MKIEPAIGFYRLLLEHFPAATHAADARVELVGCYNHLRLLDDCIAQSKKNLELDPDSKWVEYWHFLIAQSHFKLWKFEEAKTMLDAFLAKYPDGDYTKHARKCLGKIDPAWKIDASGLVSYSGKYTRDIRPAAAIKSLPKDIEAGHQMLEQRLGIDLRPHTNVIYHFVDAGKKTSPGLKASTYVIGRKNKPAVVVRFYTEYVVAQGASYRQTITHEMKHAGFKGIMSQGYENLPAWIREGLAVWGSDDVETRMQLVLPNKIAGGKDPMT
ncbi:MAG: tetratricopeptide (TPR) repeat protein, partial [Verrucomicrobiales bacterium]